MSIYLVWHVKNFRSRTTPLASSLAPWKVVLSLEGDNHRIWFWCQIYVATVSKHYHWCSLSISTTLMIRYSLHERGTKFRRIDRRNSYWGGLATVGTLQITSFIVVVRSHCSLRLHLYVNKSKHITPFVSNVRSGWKFGYSWHTFQTAKRCVSCRNFLYKSCSKISN